MALPSVPLGLDHRAAEPKLRAVAFLLLWFVAWTFVKGVELLVLLLVFKHLFAQVGRWTNFAVRKRKLEACSDLCKLFQLLSAWFFLYIKWR